ncbi:hypothetical protein [Paractinoplanes hotanensis]|uniref:Peptide chain release factor 1 n=1 Tax=Paractinoplanes hotanensis TaxID=2906497 RepID=A0ABT0XW48_9ACTN|nr:hypothetical protein [Actinoplanes hotanensis]MCM4077952.1 hypothetical protein [Actinoplanes hotanensis]
MKLDFLRPLFERPGSWVSVYLDATRAGENADHEVALRWRGLREELAGQGADAATLDAVEGAVQDHPTQPGQYGLAVFATNGDVAMVQTLSAPPPADTAWFEPLPHAASTGLVDVVARLQRGQADTVLLIDDQSSTDKLWIAPDDPTLVAVDDHVLREAGVDEPQKVRADAALVRAIAGTGADLVLIVPGEATLEHGIGAVLRYADASTAAS